MTQISGICRQVTRINSKASYGFTLVEILVVLAIVGLLAGVALPQLQNMASSVEISTQRTAIKTAIEELGYRAYVSGKPITLTNANSIPGSENTPREQPLEIPSGWRVQVLQPVIYAINGICSGGKITLIDPRRMNESFTLKPPQCRLEPIDNPE